MDVDNELWFYNGTVPYIVLKYYISGTVLVPGICNCTSTRTSTVPTVIIFLKKYNCSFLKDIIFRNKNIRNRGIWMYLRKEYVEYLHTLLVKRIPLFRLPPKNENSSRTAFHFFKSCFSHIKIEFHMFKNTYVLSIQFRYTNIFFYSMVKNIILWHHTERTSWRHDGTSYVRYKNVTYDTQILSYQWKKYDDTFKIEKRPTHFLKIPFWKM